MKDEAQLLERAAASRASQAERKQQQVREWEKAKAKQARRRERQAKEAALQAEHAKAKRAAAAAAAYRRWLRLFAHNSFYSSRQGRSVVRPSTAAAKSAGSSDSDDDAPLWRASYGVVCSIPRPGVSPRPRSSYS
ncbi:hypothetical protein JKP88DRAFT_217760 [Tribonema minus]|uniref:Uncharacterized protein n=1 Tax=Tribonema minus TaxID=303371 RepID=A0A835ZC65_9STRA|nr:hypothetical protein JKP88DRAFT_217760 [Tribonema minus]